MKQPIPSKNRWSFQTGVLIRRLDIRDFVPAASKMGYQGMVLTSWSTSGAYSYLYESEGKLSELAAIRHVYPITGFNMLISAYFESLRSREPIDVEKFIAGYCYRHYGLSREEALAFHRALNDTSIEAGAPVLHRLQPARTRWNSNITGLWPISAPNTSCSKKIEAEANAPTITPAALLVLAARLRALLAEDSALSRRFIVLNKSSFYVSELEQENELRTARIRDLYARLARRR